MNVSVTLIVFWRLCVFVDVVDVTSLLVLLLLSLLCMFVSLHLYEYFMHILYVHNYIDIYIYITMLLF